MRNIFSICLLEEPTEEKSTYERYLYPHREDRHQNIEVARAQINSLLSTTGQHPNDIKSMLLNQSIFRAMRELIPNLSLHNKHDLSSIKSYFSKLGLWNDKEGTPKKSLSPTSVMKTGVIIYLAFIDILAKIRNFGEDYLCSTSLFSKVYLTPQHKRDGIAIMQSLLLPSPHNIIGQLLQDLFCSTFLLLYADDRSQAATRALSCFDVNSQILSYLMPVDLVAYFACFLVNSRGDNLYFSRIENLQRFMRDATKDIRANHRLDETDRPSSSDEENGSGNGQNLDDGDESLLYMDQETLIEKSWYDCDRDLREELGKGSRRKALKNDGLRNDISLERAILLYHISPKMVHTLLPYVQLED